MGVNNIAIGITIAITAIATVAYFLFERRRYVTNNRNAMAEDFEVFRNPECPICYYNLEGPDCVILNCGHELHQNCLQELENHRGYLQTNRCPICRTPIRLQ